MIMKLFKFLQFRMVLIRFNKILFTSSQRSSFLFFLLVYFAHNIYKPYETFRKHLNLLVYIVCKISDHLRLSAVYCKWFSCHCSVFRLYLPYNVYWQCEIFVTHLNLLVYISYKISACLRLSVVYVNKVCCHRSIFVFRL